MNAVSLRGTKRFTAERIARGATFDVEASPSVILPLLCPVRERERIRVERPRSLSRRSRLATDCIFIFPTTSCRLERLTC